MEPLLVEQKSRHVFFPVQHDDVYRMYKVATSCFWVADEINFQQDNADLEKMSHTEKQFIYHILAFFAASDGVVMENLNERFAREVPVPEVRAFYAFQNAMEAVHSEVYSLLIDTYAKSATQKEELFNAVRHFPAIREKQEWAMKWIEDKSATFAQRLIAFAIVEGIFFSASFCAIFWLRSRGLLPGLSFANQLISRDEGLHTEFACLLYSKIEHRVPADTVRAMFREAVDIERRFITESIPCSMIGMNTDLMTQYIEYVSDRLLRMLGYAPEFDARNPFDFVEAAALESKGNFFESRVSEYNKSCISMKPGESTIPTELKINFDDDF